VSQFKKKQKTSMANQLAR